MPYENVLGLLIGIGVLAMAAGYLADACFYRPSSDAFPDAKGPPWPPLPS